MVEKGGRTVMECNKRYSESAHLTKFAQSRARKFRDTDAKRKVLQFARAFLRYMSTVSFDQRYASFDRFLQLPRSVKEQKRLTYRIVTKEDVENVLTAIEEAHRYGDINAFYYLNYKAMIFLGAFTGQRPLATTARLTVGQLIEALKKEKPDGVTTLKASRRIGIVKPTVAPCICVLAGVTL